MTPDLGWARSAYFAASVVGLLFFLFVALWRLNLPGIYYDEVLFLPPAALLFDDCSLPAGVAVKLGCIPIILQPPYLGSLKALLYGVIFNFVPVTPLTIRVPMLVLLLLGVWLFASFWRRRFSPWLGAVLLLLLLTDVVAIVHARVDWGPYVLSALFKMLAVCLSISWIESRNPWRAVQLATVLALGVFDKLNFLWIVGSLAAALTITYAKDTTAALRAIDHSARNVLVAIVALGLFWLVAWILPTIRQGDGGDRVFDVVLQAKHVWHLLSITLNIGAYEFFFREPWSGPRFHFTIFAVSLCGGLIVVGLLPRLRRRLGADSDVVRLAGYSSFSTLLVAFTVLAMVLTKEVGGTHHAVVVTQLWQLQLVALAAAAIALARSTGKGAWVPTVAASASAIAAALLAANVSSGRAWLAALNPATPINPVFTPVVYELADLTVRKPDVPLVMVDWGIGNNLQSLLPSGQRERVRDFWPMFRSIAAGSTSPAELRLALGDAKDVLFVMRSMQTAVFKDTLKGFEKVLVASSDCRSERQELKDGTAIVQFIVVLVETSCLRGAT